MFLLKTPYILTREAFDLEMVSVSEGPRVGDFSGNIDVQDPSIFRETAAIFCFKPKTLTFSFTPSLFVADQG